MHSVNSHAIFSPNCSFMSDMIDPNMRSYDCFIRFAVFNLSILWFMYGDTSTIMANVSNLPVFVLYQNAVSYENGAVWIIVLKLVDVIIDHQICGFTDFIVLPLAIGGNGV